MFPDFIFHADWSTSSSKRWMASARLEANQTYRIEQLRLVDDPRQWLIQIRLLLERQSSLLIGLDFPIGLPRHFAICANIDEFRRTLPDLGSGRWASFYQVAHDWQQIKIERPFYPFNSGDKGERSQAHLTRALRAQSMRDLLRRCEAITGGCSLFWTLGSNQVGKAAISGWKEVLTPAISDDRMNSAIWPFDGPISSLIQAGRVVFAETYPALFYHRVGVGGVSKRNSASRVLHSSSILKWADQNSIRISPTIADAIRDGFGTDSTGEDKFDALVGVCGMIDVVLGATPLDEQLPEYARTVEGWMFGLPLE